MDTISCIECQPLKVLRQLTDLQLSEFFNRLAARGDKEEQAAKQHFAVATAIRVESSPLELRLKGYIRAGRICKGCPFAEHFERLK